MQERHIDDVVRLHYFSLDKGFLSKLGLNFLKALYKAMLSSKQCFTFVYEIDSIVIGFFTACNDTDSFFHELLTKRGYLLIRPIVLQLIKHPSLFNRIIKSVRYPQLFSDKFEKGELLSLAVKEEYRGKGIGTELIAYLVDEFKKRKVYGFKTGVRPIMKQTNNFYQKNGFELIQVVKLYGEEFNFYNYYIK